MADEELLAILRRGPEAWNAWRQTHAGRTNLTKAYLREIFFTGADLRGVDLSGATLSGADLRGAHLTGATLSGANLSGADLRGAHLTGATFSGADLNGADLRGGPLRGAHFSWATLRGADIREADLRGADFCEADLSGADLSGANLCRADLSGADFSEANLRGANLRHALLIETRLAKVDLTGCRIYGMSAWDLHLEGATQVNLVITKHEQPEITVDNLEVAQLIYLLLNNERIRDVIDTITSKMVLILGRFTPERKVILEALREELRRRDYLPVLFDFDKPGSKDVTGTVQTLANMARFIIADLTDPSSVPHELAMVVPNTVAPVQAVLLDSQHEYAMFVDLKRRYHWILEPYRYDSPERLLADLGERVISPAEAKAGELRAVPLPTK